LAPLLTARARVPSDGETKIRRGLGGIAVDGRSNANSPSTDQDGSAASPTTRFARPEPSAATT